MKLWQSILNIILRDVEDEEDLAKLDYEKLFEKECYKIIERIKAILEDDSLEDEECFYKIENLVCLFEEMGQNCGARHDFG